MNLAFVVTMVVQQRMRHRTPHDFNTKRDSVASRRNPCLLQMKHRFVCEKFWINGLRDFDSHLTCGILDFKISRHKIWEWTVEDLKSIRSSVEGLNEKWQKQSGQNLWWKSLRSEKSGIWKLQNWKVKVGRVSSIDRRKCRFISKSQILAQEHQVQGFSGDHIQEVTPSLYQKLLLDETENVQIQFILNIRVHSLKK